MASYNTYFPQTYTNSPYVYGGQPQNQFMGQTVTNPNAIRWVQGEAGAKAVPVDPGQKILLMDSETNVFYLKSSDISGMPLPLRTFEYHEVGKVATAQDVEGAPSTYVTREEFDKAIAELKQLTPKEGKKTNEFDI